jgi:hypothetical protein
MLSLKSTLTQHHKDPKLGCSGILSLALNSHSTNDSHSQKRPNSWSFVLLVEYLILPQPNGQV